MPYRTHPRLAQRICMTSFYRHRETRNYVTGTVEFRVVLLIILKLDRDKGTSENLFINRKMFPKHTKTVHSVLSIQRTTHLADSSQYQIQLLGPHQFRFNLISFYLDFPESRQSDLLKTLQYRALLFVIHQNIICNLPQKFV